MDTLLQDIRHGIRSLSKRPSFTVAAMLTLAIGIGVNTAMFSILYSVLIQPLPFQNPDRLASVYRTTPEWGRLSRAGVSYPDFVDWQEKNRVFTDMGAYHSITINLTGVGEPERLAAAEISYNLLSVLGIRPEDGREFREEEGVLGAPGTVILSHGLWLRRFGGDPEMIGSIIHLDKEPHTVIGIAPRGFGFPDVAQLWTPLRLSPTAGRDVYAYWVVGRLRDGLPLEQALASMKEIDAPIIEEYASSEEDRKMTVGAMPFKTMLVGELSVGVIIFYVVVCLVLLLACANIANLMLALSTTRQTEIAIRSSLGAGRLRIARQLLTESVLLALAGGTIGMVIGLLGRDTLLRYIPLDIPHFLSFNTNLYMIISMVGIIILTGILFGIAPALTATRQDLVGTLQHGSPKTTSSSTRTRLRSTLVILEVMVATLMIVGAGLVMKSYVKLTAQDPGVDVESVLTLRVSLPEADYPDQQLQHMFFRDFAERVRSIPGVLSASVVAPFPFGSSIWQRGYTVEGKESPPEGRVQATPFWSVQSDYFSTMGIPLLQGRVFTNEDDAEGAVPVVVVTEEFARKHWPDENPLGKQIKWGRPTSERPWMEVIGVVGDIYRPDPMRRTEGGCYTILSDFPSSTMSLAIKTGDDPLNFVDAVRAELAVIDPDLPAYEVRSMENIFAETFWPIAAISWLFTVLTCIALVLAAVGIYGVIAYSVTQRTREFGIRIALGAQTRDVITLVIRQMTRLAGIGMLLGLLIAFAGLRFMASVLYGVSPSDPATYLATVLLMGGATLVASYIPARRATRVDPIEALRQE